VPAVFIWQNDPGLELLPSGNQRVIERLEHVSEALGHADSRVDFRNGLVRLGQDPAVPSRPIIRDLALFEQLDQRRAAEAQEVGGFLRSEPLRAGHDGDDFPIAQRLDDLDEDPVDLPGERGLLAVWAEQQCWLGVQCQEPAQVEQRAQVFRREDDRPVQQWAVM
jgi:hypothetical protein